MLTENNTVNWLQFACKILSDKKQKKTIRDFLRKEYGISKEYTSRNIYIKYCK